MQNENIATYISATWNGTINKKSATRKKYKIKIVQYEQSATWKWYSIRKVQHEMVQSIKRVLHEKIQNQNCAVRIKCNMEINRMKKVQHEISTAWKKCNMKKYKLPQWNMEKSEVHKSSLLLSLNG